MFGEEVTGFGQMGNMFGEKGIGKEEGRVIIG
jgi:hypothetical protein